MADEDRKESQRTQGVSKPGRSFPNSDAPARTRKQAGNTGYAGYEYQIEVTIWVALDLIFAKAVTNELTIEPPSHEDLEAAVHDSDELVLDLTCDSSRFDLMVQVKTRSGAPWRPADVATVLGGAAGESAANPRGRTRPLDLLRADERRRYVFITNEAVAASLRVHEVRDIFEVPEATRLPSNLGRHYDASEQVSLARRISFCSGVTEEVLQARIGRMLSRHGHVPSVKHGECIRNMRDEVRKRICGHAHGRWTRAEIVDVVARHGGSVAPTRAMDHYVRPHCFERIRERLDTVHAVLIAGPSGTGKTLTADILEVELRNFDPPFRVVGEENGPAHVRHHLLQAGPILFHLRDPWGGNRLTPGADRWGGELPKLLNSAGPEKKFVITSRSDVLKSAGLTPMKELEHYTVSIEVEDYGPERLRAIYDGIASDLTGHARSLAQAYRESALRSLSRPYEIDRFLVALSQEDGDKPRKVRDIVADSQISAISDVIADQMRQWSDDAVQGAAIIWGLLVARGAVGRGVFPRLLRRIRSADSSVRPNVDELIDFLVAGRNLRQDGAALSFYHPRVEDGLRLALMTDPGETEHILSLVMDALAALDSGDEDWGIETSLGVLRATVRLDNLELAPAAGTRERLDAHLVANATAARYLNFEGPLADLACFGSTTHLPSRLARLLVAVQPETEQFFSVREWRAPDLTDDEIDELKNDRWTPKLIERFVREGLPFTRTNYGQAISSLLLELVPSIEGFFWDALDIVADPGGPNENIEAVVAGACGGASPAYDRAIARFAKSEEDAGAWMESEYAEQARQAEEHEVDAIIADRILEEPGERYYNAQTGMQTVASLRLAREGLAWVSDHPHRQSLISAMVRLFEKGTRSPSPSELRLLLNAAKGWVRTDVWRLVKQHWHVELADLLLAELRKSDLNRDLRRTLIEIAALAGDDARDHVSLLREAARHVSSERQLELFHDLMLASIDDDSELRGDQRRAALAERLIDRLPNGTSELARLLVALMSGKEIRTSAGALSGPARTQLSTLLNSVSADVAAPLLCAAAAIGLDINSGALRLLSTGEADHGVNVVQALLIDRRPRAIEILYEALKHRRYRVRRDALGALVRNGYSKEENRLVAAADDPSAQVRLAFARLMQEYKWPRAIDQLVKIMGDRHNFSSDFGMTSGPFWSRFSVARRAAQALGAYDTLPPSAAENLLRVAEEGSPDPFVACSAISALACRDDSRVWRVVVAALESPGLEGASQYRPRAQAAAWAVFDRIAAAKLVEFSAEAMRIACEDRPAIAGPLLMSVGICGGRKRETLLDDLIQADLSKRIELLRVTAVASGTATDLSLKGYESALARMQAGVSERQLSPEERTELEQWSRSLDPDHDVEYFTTWIANSVFKLPVSKEITNLRAFDLPRRIGVITMSSLTLASEEVAGADDGT